MKKILIITPYCPYPAHKSGGTHALFNISKENGKFGNIIDLLYYDKEDINAELELKKYFNNISYIDLRKKESMMRIKSILKGIPYGIYQYDEKLLKISEKYDQIIFDQPLSMRMVNSIQCENKILISYDSMNLYFKRKSQMNKKNILEKIYNLIQSSLYKKNQECEYKKFTKIFFVSKSDARYEQNQLPIVKNKIDYINLGVDYNKFSNESYNQKSEKTIIFTGIMNYGPNKDAAIYFAKNVMPQILKVNNDVKFIIVGKNPDEEIYNLANSNIIVTGFVDDIVEYIVNSDVYVSPLRYGTGMKNKILEAMSCGKAIVASETSIEGIDYLTDGKNIYIAKSQQEWVEKVNELLNNKELNSEFGKKCREIILNNFSWDKAYKKIFD